MNNQFIQGVSFDWNKIDAGSYLREIDAIDGNIPVRERRCTIFHCYTFTDSAWNSGL